jgi:predicted amidohydrolase YtcJ
MTPRWLAALPIFALVSAMQAGADQKSIIVINNAHVLTLDDRSSVGESVAIQGDRIIAVGDTLEVGFLAEVAAMESGRDVPRTVIDAKGRTLLPGLYDSHVHPLGASTSEAKFAIPSFDSIDAVLAFVRDRASKQPVGTWIVARYAFPTRLKEGRLPTRAELDAAAPDHPVLHQAGPAGVANTKALVLSGITRETPDPPAGAIVRDPSTGEATGLLRNAYSVLKGLPDDAYAAKGTDQDAEFVRSLFRRYNERGLTSVGDRSASDEAMTVYRALRDRGELTVRVNATRVLKTAPDADLLVIRKAIIALAADGPTGEPNGPTGVGDHFIRVGPLKVFLDGGMLNGTAYMRTPWGVGATYQITEPEYRGLLFVSPPTLALIAEEAARRGWSMTAHIAGEAAMDELLAAYQHAERAVGIRGKRWLMTHANFASAENLRIASELGVGADIQPAWLLKDTRVLRSVLGDERMDWFHPYRRWRDAGVLIGGGSDHMIRMDPIGSTNPWDPWLGMEIAQTRRTEGAGIFRAEEGLTREEMLRFYTIWNAELHGEEKEKGSIEQGKLADLILVDRDPLTCPPNEISQTKVLWTMVGGRIVFDSGQMREP